MIVKNISGATRTLAFSNKVCMTVPDDGLIIIPDDPEVVADALRYANEGLISIQQEPAGNRLVQPTFQPERILLDFAGQPSDGDTLEYGPVTFEFDSNSTVVSGNVAVEIGLSRSATLENLLEAISSSAALAGHSVRGLVDDGARAVAAVVLPYGALASEFNVDTSDATNVTHFAKEAEGGETLQRVFLMRKAATATLLQDLVFSTELRSIVHASAYVYNGTARKAWDGVLHFSDTSGTIVLDQSGSTDVANGDTIVVEAYGVA